MKTGKTFAVLINWISPHYHKQVWEGIQNYCDEKSINLMTFVTGRPGSPLAWEKMRNQLFDMIDEKRFDGLLVFSGTMEHPLGVDAFAQFMTRYQKIPLVSIGEVLPKCPSILIDGKSGFQLVLQHLYGHGYRRFVFVSGPTAARDALERLHVFQKFIADHQLETSPDHILIGDFDEETGQKAVRTFIDEKKLDFEVLVAANDDIALGALEEFTAKNLLVPGDYFVSGFDDILSSGEALLTTVNQPLFEMGRHSARTLDDFSNGKNVKPVTALPTSLVVRQSCGCLSPAVREAQTLPLFSSLWSLKDLVLQYRDEILTDLQAEGLHSDASEFLLESFVEAMEKKDHVGFFNAMRRLLFNLQKKSTPSSNLHYPLSVLRRWAQQAEIGQGEMLFLETILHQGRILISEAVQTQSMQEELHRTHQNELLSLFNESLIYAKTFEEQKAFLCHFLPKLGVEEFYLSFYTHPEKPMEEARLVLAHDDNGRKVLPEEGVAYKPSELFPSNFEATQPWSFVVETLFDRSKPLGLLLLSSRDHAELLPIFDALCEKISHGIALVQLILDLEATVRQRTEDLQEALDELESFTEQLKELALRDELTGLYNRRGFLTLAEHQIRFAKRQGKPIVLFFGDMDGLKRINDTWGHKSGDDAIRKTARMLASDFRSTDIVARLGGDEFTVLASDCSTEDAEELAKRLQLTIKKFNNSAERPWKLGLSLGWVVVDDSANVTLADWMQRADTALYAEKEKRHTSRRSEN